MKVAIVHLYGLYLNERPAYKKYLEYIAKEIHREKYDKVILCGGYTRPDHPHKSEASTAEEFMKTLIDFNEYILEDQSITTNQNLEFAAKHLKTLERVDETVIYGDLIRKPKIAWIALHELLGLSKKEIYKILIEFIHERDIYKDIKYKNIRIHGFDFPRKTREEMIGMSYTAVLDVLALYDEELSEIDLEFRRKLFGLE